MSERERKKRKIRLRRRKKWIYFCSSHIFNETSTTRNSASWASHSKTLSRTQQLSLSDNQRKRFQWRSRLEFPERLALPRFFPFERKVIFAREKSAERIARLLRKSLQLCSAQHYEKAISWWHDVSKPHSGALTRVFVCWRWLYMVFHSVLCFRRISDRHTTSQLLIYFSHSTRRGIKPPARIWRSRLRRKIPDAGSYLCECFITNRASSGVNVSRRSVRLYSSYFIFHFIQSYRFDRWTVENNIRKA